MKKIETFIIFETVKKSEVKRFDLGNQPQATVYEHHLFAQSITITKVNLSPLGEKKQCFLIRWDNQITTNKLINSMTNHRTFPESLRHLHIYISRKHTMEKY